MQPKLAMRWRRFLRKVPFAAKIFGLLLNLIILIIVAVSLLRTINDKSYLLEHVMPHLKKTLMDLRLEYLGTPGLFFANRSYLLNIVCIWDVWLMHWPVAFKYVPYDGERRGFHASYDPDACSELPEVKNSPNPRTAKVLIVTSTFVKVFYLFFCWGSLLTISLIRSIMVYRYVKLGRPWRHAWKLVL